MVACDEDTEPRGVDSLIELAPFPRKASLRKPTTILAKRP